MAAEALARASGAASDRAACRLYPPLRGRPSGVRAPERPPRSCRPGCVRGPRARARARAPPSADRPQRDGGAAERPGEASARGRSDAGRVGGGSPSDSPNPVTEAHEHCRSPSGRPQCPRPQLVSAVRSTPRASALAQSPAPPGQRPADDAGSTSRHGDGARRWAGPATAVVQNLQPETRRLELLDVAKVHAKRFVPRAGAA